MDQNIINLLKNGGVGILPRDTLYGLVGRALNQETVTKIYHLKGRSSHKPLIILISSVEDLKLFNISLSEKFANFLMKIWPNPLNVILPCPDKKFTYLHRGAQSLAFRIPDKADLLQILQAVGPLVAPSANPESLPPAQNLKEAKKYFGNQVNFYIDGGNLSSQPSTLITLENDQLKILRQGIFQIPKKDIVL